MGSAVTTHVLDTSRGCPAEGVPVRLVDDQGSLLAQGVTDGDGRVGDLGPSELPAGTYRLTFDTAAYFGEMPSFHPEVTVAFVLDPSRGHHHLPLLLSPFAYSTYRGS